MVDMSKFIYSFIIFDISFLVAAATFLITTCKACSTESKLTLPVIIAYSFEKQKGIPDIFGRFVCSTPHRFLIGSTCVFYFSGCVVSLIHIFVCKLFHYMQISLALTFPQQC